MGENLEETFVGREYRWQEFQEDLFALGASYCTGRIVDILSLKRRVPTFTLDCTDAHHQAPELDDVLASSWHEHKHLVGAAETVAGSTPSWSTMGRSFHVCVSGRSGFHEVCERTAVLLECRPSGGDGGAHG